MDFPDPKPHIVGTILIARHTDVYVNTYHDDLYNLYQQFQPTYTVIHTQRDTWMSLQATLCGPWKRGLPNKHPA